MKNTNFLLQPAKCICEQITTVNMIPCGICGNTAQNKHYQQRKAKADKQRQAFLKKYGNKIPF